MDWTWLEQLPEPVRYSIPLAAAIALLTLYRVVGSLADRLAPHVGPYVVFNALAVLGVVLGQCLLGLHQDGAGAAYERVGMSLFVVSAVGLVAYNVILWAAWVNGWEWR